MPVVEAIAIEPRLKRFEYDPAGDIQGLRNLAEWASRFSPLVGLEDDPVPQSLLLDITGCAPLFHGEERLLDQVAEGLRRQGWNARIAIADTIGAAWALAHYGPAQTLATGSQTELLLRPLPVSALRLPEETVECVNALGLECIGELIDLPRSSVPARLGPTLLNRLDQALGRAPEILVPYHPPPEIDAICPFEWPTDRREALRHALDWLTNHIHEKLSERHWGARQLECWLYHEGIEPTRIALGLSRPSRASAHLRLLLHTRLERVVIPASVSGIRLCVSAAVPLDDAQADLLDDEHARDAAELAVLVDQLSSRLGHEAVTHPKVVADAQPECACCLEPAVSRRLGGTGGSSTSVPGPVFLGPTLVGKPSVPPDEGHATTSMIAPSVEANPPVRPLRLWRQPISVPAVSVVPQGPPLQFRWMGVDRRVASSWGPERIETGWWRGNDVHRDYYVVETTDGARFWIFRRRDDGKWFLHGCFD
jgi:protein ImuB